MAQRRSILLRIHKFTFMDFSFFVTELDQQEEKFLPQEMNVSNSKKLAMLYAFLRMP